MARTRLPLIPEYYSSLQFKRIASDIERRFDLLEATLAGYFDEDVWTPTLFGSTTAGSPVYAANGQKGTWRRSRNVVLFTGWLSITNKDIMAGDLMVGGFPKLSRDAVSPKEQGGAIFHSVVGLTHTVGYTQWSGRMEDNAQTMAIVETGSAVSDVRQTVANTANTTQLGFFGHYFL